MAYMFETVVCPFCGNGHAHITYEENRVYQLNCPDCHNAIFHTSGSWDTAVGFFKRMGISDDARIRELLAASDEGRLVVLPCKVGDTVYAIDWYLDCDIDGFGVCDDYEKNGDRACGYCQHNYVKKFVREKKYELQMLDEIGKTVFLSREEAEAALKGGTDDGKV